MMKKQKKKGTGRLHEQIEPEFVRITREGSMWMYLGMKMKDVDVDVELSRLVRTCLVSIRE